MRLCWSLSEILSHVRWRRGECAQWVSGGTTASNPTRGLSLKLQTSRQGHQRQQACLLMPSDPVQAGKALLRALERRSESSARLLGRCPWQGLDRMQDASKVKLPVYRNITSIYIKLDAGLTQDLATITRCKIGCFDLFASTHSYKHGDSSPVAVQERLPSLPLRHDHKHLAHAHLNSRRTPA